MKALSPEISALLDKLYNLRGDESVILVEMAKQKSNAEETKTRTTAEKKELQEKISELESLHESLEEQGNLLVDVLSNINRDDYATLLDRLRIDFDPQNLVDKINKALPRTIDSVTLETKKAAEKLVKVETEMDDAIEKIEDLGKKRDTALANQEKLNEYFELALTGKINITRDSITTLLAQFNFTEEEQREAAKILMFPEDALLTYDERLRQKERSGKTISEVIAEAKSYEPASEAVSIVPEEPTPLEVKNDEPADLIVEKDNKEKLMELLKENNIDYLDYTAAELDSIIDNYDEEVITNNIKCLQDSSIDTDIFVNHANLMTDKELPNKITTLLNIGKDPVDIYLNPNVLEKYNEEELNTAIENLKTNGMDPKNVPLIAF